MKAHVDNIGVPSSDGNLGELKACLNVDDIRRPPSVSLVDFLATYNRIIMPVWVFDIDRSRVYWANPAALDLWRTDSLDELQERNMRSEMSPMVAERLKQYQQDFVHGASFTEMWTLYPNGDPCTMRLIFSGIRLDDGRMAMFCQAVEEGTQSPETPDTLRSAQALLHTTVMISLYGLDGEALYYNPAARAAQVSGTLKFCDRFVHLSDYEDLQGMLNTSGMASVVAQISTSRGTRWHEVTARESRDAVTGTPALLISEVDVSDLKETEQKANFLALHDVLTGLPNRTYLHRELKDQLNRALCLEQRRGLLFIDLDHFKNINDSLGHAVGDMLLIEVARRIRECARREDIVARIGGDEFVVFVDEIPTRDHINALAERIQEALILPIRINEHSLRITPSIGVSIFPDDGNDLDTLMKNADLAMYEAKDAGRNQHCFFSTDMQARVENRLALESDLRQSLVQSDLVLFYQPQVCVESDTIKGAEALVRWNHPTRGLLGPGEFIGVAEETGLIEPMGEWIIRTAAAQQRKWMDEGHDISVAVNLSPRQFKSETLIPSIERIMVEEGSEPSKIHFEITESMLMGNSERITHALHRLHGMGFNLAIDDFGTGYSNLAYLQRYPINYLKIDRSFIDDLDQTSAIAELIISMCKLLNVKIVAEGVEDERQLHWLKEKNCHKYQGFYFSPAIPADDFTELLCDANPQPAFKRAAQAKSAIA